MTTQTPLFNNLTDERVQLEYWVSTVPGLSSQKCLVIEPNTEVPIPKSNVDEWIVYLEKTHNRLGKFRMKPSYDGECSWIENMNFLLEYVNTEFTPRTYFIKRIP